MDVLVEKYSQLPLDELMLMFSASAQVLIASGALTTSDLKQSLDAAEEVKGEPI